MWYFDQVEELTLRNQLRTEDDDDDDEVTQNPETPGQNNNSISIEVMNEPRTSSSLLDDVRRRVTLVA